MPAVIDDVIAKVLDRVNAISAPGPGFTRPSYSSLETAAHAVIVDEVRRLGLEVRWDAVLIFSARYRGAIGRRRRFIRFASRDGGDGRRLRRRGKCCRRHDARRRFSGF